MIFLFLINNPETHTHKRNVFFFKKRIIFNFIETKKKTISFSLLTLKIIIFL